MQLSTTFSTKTRPRTSVYLNNRFEQGHRGSKGPSGTGPFAIRACASFLLLLMFISASIPSLALGADVVMRLDVPPDREAGEDQGSGSRIALVAAQGCLCERQDGEKTQRARGCSPA